MNIEVGEENANGCCKFRRRHWKRYVIIAVAVCALIAAAVVYLTATKPAKLPDRESMPDAVYSLPPSPSILHRFRKAAVCTDGPPCSEIGKNILDRNGSAIDAAIAAMFCNGLVNMQSMGLGGGFLMTVYIRAENKAYAVNAREQAPRNATEDMFAKDQKAATTGPLSVAVPGELRGMWAAHLRWGRLPWADLVQPSINLCHDGFNITKVLWDGLHGAKNIINDENLREMFFDSKTNKFVPGGTLVKPSSKFCRTLQMIAENGGDDLYNGTLAVEFAEDLKMVGSIITAADLEKYQAKISEPITVPLMGGNVLYTVPPPSSGVLLGFILNILGGYNFTPQNLENQNSTVLTYHRIVEAFKYAYAKRTLLGDVDFVNIQKLITNLTSPTFAETIRNQINDTWTSNKPEDYGADFFKADHGTAHISILSENGDAVSVTSSVNYYFGAGFTTSKTGIVMNNGMDDFSSPGFNNYFGLPGSPANAIQPYKRSMSSMSPSIIVDKDGDVKIVIGASGGTKITTSIALVIMRLLWFNQTIKEAVDAPRFHHQIYPMDISYEYGVLEDVVNGLKSKGHKMQRYHDRGSIICALFRNTSAIYGNADYRKGGDVFGLD